MTGPLSKIGVDVKAALAACFGEINSQGGIQGRKLELAVEDSGGEAAGTEQATRRLVEERGVFALVGSFEPKGSASTNEYLRRNGVPLIGPVTLSPPSETQANRYVFYLLPGLRDQARVLVDGEAYWVDEFRLSQLRQGLSPAELELTPAADD